MSQKTLDELIVMADANPGMYVDQEGNVSPPSEPDPAAEPREPWVWVSGDIKPEAEAELEKAGLWSRMIVLSDEKGETLWELMLYKEDGVMKRMEINYVPRHQGKA